ncbi:DnaT-like ssDNA-binding protein [Acidovorax sp. FJL06]|uniref:DnaT-like ssDNA-binding protein n=1 Tax=Acidovorax sp. FJL06 TaxID=2153365 RepID=UPI000F5615B5|nr:DnaT-like ssDNA-binding protein [Acidovorax sp. FJL06]RQO83493.1 hypothetical protein DBV10_03990 [Acidovorax sp. FJL06]
MSLIVAPTAGAESYISVANADAYHAARGNSAWALLTPDAKEQALRKATDYMGRYSGRWKGERLNAGQVLDWPRAGVVVDGYEINWETVPAAIANACALLALKASAGDIAPDLGPQKQSVKVGPIETTYAAGTRQATRYQSAETLLAPYLLGSAGQVRVVRA